MDDAFLRRLQFVVDFPMPAEPQRELIWRNHFPPAAPRDASIDLPFLARQFKLSGGSIRNIVFSAAFAAAEEGAPIAMRHLTAALRIETLKEGKLLMKAELGPYFDLMEAPAREVKS
jgi:ATP-dependent 26S proteasome regulatory subunit